MSSYLVPKQRTRVELRVSNSRFIATIERADSMKAAQTFLREIRAEMPDATHHVHAFKIGYGDSVSEGMSDDGEPSGTSGPPTLAVLRGAEIGDVALVTTRYFGGTKLGTGGLVSAYTSAAKAALEAVETELKVTRVPLRINLPYPLNEPVRRLLESHECVIEHKDYGETVIIDLLIAEERVTEFSQQLADLSAGRVRPTRRDEE